jgi:hypothetical protein
LSGRISLALTLHNHQPVGNFGWVIAETYEQAYRPMVEALERHPGVRVALHYSGPLLGWLRAERPDFVARLAGLAERGQIEIVGGGWYEPVLAALPERDRVGQLGRMADELEATFGRRPRGAWLAERVWEPDLPTALVSAGYDWTVLDDAHFRAAAIPEDDLWGSYTTDDQGKVLTVFGTEQGLRYRIPFADVEDVIGYLRDHATDDGERLGTMGDDGEKFGAWPTTWEHCWGEGRWVERFFDALDDNAGWLTTMPPSDWTVAHRPVGRVYLPTGSYAEMGEWALPARAWRSGPPCAGRGQSAGPKRAGCAARSGATFRSATARSTTSTSRCSPPAISLTRCPPAPTGRQPSTTSSRASPTIVIGTACSAGSTCRTCESPRSAGSLPRRTSPPAIGPRPASCATSTSTIATRSSSRAPVSS